MKTDKTPVIDAWKDLYTQIKEENLKLKAENERLRMERDNANKNIERLSALSTTLSTLSWHRPVGF